MSTLQKNLCPRCGTSLDVGQVDGLCARCLSAVPFKTDTAVVGNAGGAHAEFSRADLEDSFPQLEILDLLGRGGMGIVYKARQKELDCLVALKLLPPALVADPRFAARFRREAQALAALAHPHIVVIHDFGYVNGMYFLLMEHVDGVNLRQAMNAGRLSPQHSYTNRTFRTEGRRRDGTDSRHRRARRDAHARGQCASVTTGSHREVGRGGEEACGSARDWRRATMNRAVETTSLDRAASPRGFPRHRNKS